MYTKDTFCYDLIFLWMAAQSDHTFVMTQGGQGGSGGGCPAPPRSGM
jgi:hypothetical protein